MGKLIVVVGGQYGSEGKGRAVQALAEQEFLDARDRAALTASGEYLSPLVVRVGGPNAGHCVTDQNGDEYKFRQVPAAAVVPGVDLAIGPGSEVDRDLLHDEIRQTLKFGNHLEVDRSVTIMNEYDSFSERSSRMNDRLGSTQSGVGEARVRRIRREADLFGFTGTDVSSGAMRRLAGGGTVIVEGTQGLGLGQHFGHYPKCTSIDCRAIDMLSLAGISPWDAAITEFQVWIVLRTFPIRVAGDSGPLWNETTWEQVGVDPEITTVTKRERRVGEWDSELARQAVLQNGGINVEQTRIWLSMLDYLEPGLAGHDGQVGPGAYGVVDDWATRLRRTVGLVPSAYGTGKTSTLWADVHDRGWWDPLLITGILERSEEQHDRAN